MFAADGQYALGASLSFLIGLPYQREPPEEEELLLIPELLPELLLDPELLPMPDDEP
jgi:hypothetical protein